MNDAPFPGIFCAPYVGGILYIIRYVDAMIMMMLMMMIYGTQNNVTYTYIYTSMYYIIYINSSVRIPVVGLGGRRPSIKYIILYIIYRHRAMCEVQIDMHRKVSIKSVLVRT